MVRKMGVVFTGVACGLFLFITAAVAQEAAAPKPPPRFSLQQPITDFSAKALDGTMMSWEQNLKKAGKPTLINFMQTACSACLTEMNYLTKVREEFGDAITIWTVAVDLQEAAAVERYVKTFPQFDGMNFLLDKELLVAKRFGFTSTPSLAVITKDGTYLKKVVGFSPAHAEVLSEAIKSVK